MDALIGNLRLRVHNIISIVILHVPHTSHSRNCHPLLASSSVSMQNEIHRKLITSLIQFVSMDSVLVITSLVRGLSFVSFPGTSSVNTYTLTFFKLKNSRRSNLSPLAVNNSLNSRNPNFHVEPFSYIVPLFQKARDFAVKSSKPKWGSVFHDLTSQETEFLQNGAFGTALMSVTATAKVKISPFVATLAANPTFVSGLCAWAASQSMKVFLNFCVERKWDFRIMFASGGMPSSHSALCTDSLFPVCLGFSLIVMYDAIGVRRHAGMQAQVLNLIVEDLFQGHPISQRKLKELLVHTPSQVFAGALLGIFVAWICCQICLFPA